MKIMDLELISQTDPEDGGYAEGYFSWSGCDNPDCDAHMLGATVYPCIGYETLAKAQEDPEENRWAFVLCANCLYEHEYGERPE